MSRQWIRFAIALAILVLPVLAAYGEDESEQARSLAEEVEGSLTRVTEACGTAWSFDNLRPMAERAIWPVGTVFNPPQGPVVHLSPGSPRYQEIVGEIAFWDSVYSLRTKRLKQPRTESTSEVVRREVFRLERDLDYAKAEYRRACAWAWSFSSLRPRVQSVYSEIAPTIVNPFLPGPTVNLSSASPDHKKIVDELQFWEAALPLCEKRLKGLLEKDKAGEGTAAATQIAAQRERELQSVWGAWQIAAGNLQQLMFTANQLQLQISSSNAKAPMVWHMQLNRTQDQIDKLQPTVIKLERQLQILDRQWKK